MQAFQQNDIKENDIKLKKIPLRKCVACQQMIDKKLLIRVVRTADNKYLVDKFGKMSGRGAYICKSTSCLEKAKKSKGFERSFKSGAPKDIYQKLEELKSELFIND